MCLVAAYALYGRWIAKTWGIDPTAKTPAVRFNDGKDYVPTDGLTVFSHQFSSIAGAGPVTGAIQAAAFGWLPVLLWILLGGIFFRRRHRLWRPVRQRQERRQVHGPADREVHRQAGPQAVPAVLLAVHLLVIAAFADMVAGTFNAFGTDGALAEAAQTNGAAGTISLLFIVFAMIFGLLQKNFHLSGLEGSCGGPGVHRRCPGPGHDDAPDRQPGDLDLHHLRVHLLRRCPAHVAAETSPATT